MSRGRSIYRGLGYVYTGGLISTPGEPRGDLCRAATQVEHPAAAGKPTGGHGFDHLDGCRAIGPTRLGG